ncbi:MAG: hypothetical protein ACOCQY_01740 [Halorhabdus sp.]
MAPYSRYAMAQDPDFTIPARPRREYDRAGRLSYEGQTLFRLEPNDDVEDAQLRALLDGVLESGPYRHGDFLDLPMLVYLVRDEETGDVFRVSVRDGAIRLHVLPATESPGLRRLFERLRAAGEFDWTVHRETTDG